MSPNFEKVDDEILTNYFLSDFRTGYVNAGNYVLPECFNTIAEAIEKFSVKNNDVWVCSFPKTGTTWTQEMVWMLANDLDFEGGKVFLPERFPFLELTCLFDFSNMIKERDDFKPPDTFLDSVGYVEKLKDPRFIKTHLPWDLLPNQIKNDEKQPKIIYVARNPKDTCVSYYYHCRFIEGYKGNFEDFTKLFLQGRLSFGPFWKHVLGYWKQSEKENVLFLTYEELKKDLPSVIRRVASFIGKKVNCEQVEILTKHLSFESMKNNYSVNYEAVTELNKTYNLTDENGAFMRSGQVGSYKADMTPEVIAEFDAWTRKELEGVDFPYPELIN